MRDLVDRALGKYIILEEIGRGGMGAVYKARDVELNRIVAIKVLSPYLVGEPHLVQRFMREARLAANLDHPHIVTIYDIGGEGGYYYFVMKFLDGRPLKEVLVERAPLPLAEVVAIAQQLAAALDYAHGQNIIHRDVKPGNVIVGSDGQCTLTDFGLAKVAENLKLTASGEAIGTLEYMAPEQARGETDKRSDIYSLGVMVYEMIAGRLPFQGTNQASLLYQHLHEPPPPLHQWRPEIPPEVDQVVMKAMAKDPAERYPTAGEFAHALEQAILRARLPIAAPHRPVERALGRAAPAPSGPTPAGQTPSWTRLRPAWWSALRTLFGVTLPAWFLARWSAIVAFAAPRRWVLLGAAGVLLVGAALVLGGILLVRSLASPPPISTPMATATAPAVLAPPSVRVHRQHLILTKGVALAYAIPVSPTVGQAELAMICPNTDGSGEYLAVWRWGQANPMPWPASSPVAALGAVSWSPNGARLAAMVRGAARINLFTVNMTETLRVTDLTGQRQDPAWSPDGRQIAFASGPMGQRKIALVLPTGQGLATITSGPSDDWAPAWSPSGSHLLFVSNRDDPANQEIYRYDMISEKIERLTKETGLDIYPAPGPDGRWIAFLSDRSGDLRLYLLDAQTYEARLLFDGAVWPERPTWSPDGQWLAFSRKFAGERARVFFLNVATGKLIAGPPDCRWPAWRP